MSEHRMSPCKYLDKGQPLKAQYPMGNAMADSPGANILPGNSLLVLFQLAVADITANTASCYLECLSYLLSFFFFFSLSACFLVSFKIDSARRRGRCNTQLSDAVTKRATST